jgi:hypothetical protein
MSGIRWWQWLPWLPWRLVVVVEAADEIPNRMPRNGIALVGSQGYPKWLAFDCPCRTGHRVMVNLDPARSPRWRLSGEKALTIWPSFDCRQPQRRCHYLITHGRVVWVSEKEHRT